MALSVQPLAVSPNLEPIRARHFPLDDVLISPSGFLGFSGQQRPIVLPGEVQSNFVPSPSRGGGSTATPPPPPPTGRILRVRIQP